MTFGPGKWRVIAVLLAALTPLAAKAQSQQGGSEPTPAIAPYANLIRTTFIVPDVDDALRLYRDILGYKVTYRAPYSGTTFRALFNLGDDDPVEFAILKPAHVSRNGPGSDIGLLATTGAAKAGPSTSPYLPRYGNTILFTTTKDLKVIYQRVLVAGPDIAIVVAPPFDTNGGREMVISDPHGVRIYVFERD